MIVILLFATFMFIPPRKRDIDKWNRWLQLKLLLQFNLSILIDFFQLTTACKLYAITVRIHIHICPWFVKIAQDTYPLAWHIPTSKSSKVIGPVRFEILGLMQDTYFYVYCVYWWSGSLTNFYGLSYFLLTLYFFSCFFVCLLWIW